MSKISLSTIDKLETERDVLLEEVDKLRNWIVKNKGEGDEDITEEGDWVATRKNNIFRNSDRLVGLVGQTLKSKDGTTTSQEEAWEAGRIPQFPSTLHDNKSKEEGKFASGGASTSTPLTTADTFESTNEDQLYSDEYLSLAGTEDDDDDESFQKSYHGTTIASQSTGQDDSTIGSVDAKDTADIATKNEVTEKKKKKRWGLSVKPRRKGSVPTSPNCVSQT